MLAASSTVRPLIDRESAFASAEQVIRHHSKTFYFATELLPAQQRRAIRALYAFCRGTDDLVDAANATRQQLEDWRAANRLSAAEQGIPLLAAWAHVREEYQVDRRYEEELIDGVGTDLGPVSMQTWSELEQYCYLVASTVGLLSIPVIGIAKGATFEQAAPYAIQLGIALQLTNILRDVGEDLDRGRIYLPAEDLDRFGLTHADIRAQIVDDRFRALMRFEIQRARDLYQAALPGILLLDRRSRAAVGAAALLYRAILDEIETLDYQVFLIRAHTSAWRKLSMLPGILLHIQRLPQPTCCPAT